jgi:hypothetical protein
LAEPRKKNERKKLSSAALSAFYWFLKKSQSKWILKTPLPEKINLEKKVTSRKNNWKKCRIRPRHSQSA